MKKSAPAKTASAAPASAAIDAKINQLGDWRGDTLARLRELIREADPEIEEEWKWVKVTNPGTPVWSHEGIVCTGETYKQVVKLTFARGASIRDPKELFNSSLEGNVRRAIDVREGEKIDEAAFKQLIRAAVAANQAARAGRKKGGRMRRAGLETRTTPGHHPSDKDLSSGTPAGRPALRLAPSAAHSMSTPKTGTP